MLKVAANLFFHDAHRGFDPCRIHQRGGGGNAQRELGVFAQGNEHADADNFVEDPAAAHRIAVTLGVGGVLDELLRCDAGKLLEYGSDGRGDVLDDVWLETR